MTAILHGLPKEKRQHLWKTFVHAAIATRLEPVQQAPARLCRVNLLPSIPRFFDVPLLRSDAVSERIKKALNVRLLLTRVTGHVKLVIAHGLEHTVHRSLRRGTSKGRQT